MHCTTPEHVPHSFCTLKNYSFSIGKGYYLLSYVRVLKENKRLKVKLSITYCEV